MTTKLHKAYRLNKKTYYYHKCDCGNTFTARDDKKPKSCGCLQGRPKSVDIETNTNNVEIIPKTHKRCYMCKNTLELNNFYNGSSRCRECSRIYKKENRHKYKDKDREYSLRHRLRVLGLTEEEYLELVKYREKLAEAISDINSLPIDGQLPSGRAIQVPVLPASGLSQVAQNR